MNYVKINNGNEYPKIIKIGIKNKGLFTIVWLKAYVSKLFLKKF